MKRILAFTLIFAMLFTAMLGIMPSADATEQAKKLDITRANVEFASTVYLLIEVNYAAAGLVEADSANVRVDVTNTVTKKTTTLTPETLEGVAEGCVGFKYIDLSAKEMGDVLTIKAYVDGGDEALTDTVDYSILEYAVKVKATSSDAALKAALYAMLDFGAAAQVAFDHQDKASYVLNENNADGIGYGLVLIGGADEATRKTFDVVGTQVDPVMDTTIFAEGGDGKIYDMSFEARNLTNRPIKVTEGISRYFYYGQDIAGDTTKFMDINVVSGAKAAAGLGALKIVTGLDFAGQYAGAEQIYDFSNHMNLNRKTSIAYNAGTSYKINNIQNSSSRLVNGGVRPWQVDVWSTNNNGFLSNPKNGTSMTLAPTTTLEDGTVVPGHLYLHPASGNLCANAISISNAQAGMMNAFLDAEGKMTVSITMAVGASRGYISCDFHTGFKHTVTNADYTEFLPLVSDPVHIFGINGRVLSIGGSVISGGGKYAKEWQFSGQTAVGNVKAHEDAGDKTIIDAADFVTYHFVLDANKGTVTAYTAGVLGGVTVKVADGALTDAQLDYFFNLTCKGDTYIKRLALSEGDIFN